MPCYSTIVNTAATDADRLGEALEALGYVLVDVPTVRGAHSGRRFANDELLIKATRVTAGGTESVVFSRRAKTDGFSYSEERTRADHAIPVLRKYAELGARAFAKARGYQIQVNGNQVTMKRGY